MRIALAQLHSIAGDVDANLAQAAAAIERAAARGADLVAFPELFLGRCLPGRDGGAGALPRGDGRLRELAPPGRPAVTIGFCERWRDRCYNSSAFVHEGRIMSVHRKVALVRYPPFDEHLRFSAGDSVQAFDGPWGRTSMLVCNDAWQPSLFERAAREGAELVVIAVNSADSSFTAVADLPAVWSDIARTHAQLLQCFVAVVNRVGVEDGMRFWGGSQLVGPDGAVLAQAARYEEELVVADLDLDHARRLRHQAPLLDGAGAAPAHGRRGRLAADVLAARL